MADSRFNFPGACRACGFNFDNLNEEGLCPGCRDAGKAWSAYQTANPCEWDPARDAPALGDGTGCPNEATISVGAAGEWHLCERCASLPRFGRFRVRRQLNTDEETSHVG